MAVNPGGPSEFDLARKRAQEQNLRERQMAQDAIKRRAASLGNLKAGVTMKQQQIANTEGAKQLANVNEGIDVAERAEFRRQAEIKEARDFAKSEREAQQAFAAEQALLQRQQQAQQFEKQFGMAKEQFQKQFDLQMKDFDLRETMSKEQSALAKQAAEIAMEQWDLQKRSEVFNAIQSIANQKLSEDQVNAMVGILGPDIMKMFDGDIATLFGKPAKKPAASAQPAASPSTPSSNQKLWNGKEWVSVGEWNKQRRGIA